MIDILILFVLLSRDTTMYAIRKRINELFGAYTNPSFGAIKPALKRLEKKECINTSKILSDGGKLSVYYSITAIGKKELTSLLLAPLSSNPIQFLSDARLKLSCSSHLKNNEVEELYIDIKTNALLHKNNAENILNNEYTNKTYQQKVVLDNVICEYKNIINLVEGLSRAGNR